MVFYKITYAWNLFFISSNSFCQRVFLNIALKKLTNIILPLPIRLNLKENYSVELKRTQMISALFSNIFLSCYNFI